MIDRLAAILGRQPFYLALRELRGGDVKLTPAALARIYGKLMALHMEATRGTTMSP